MSLIYKALRKRVQDMVSIIPVFKISYINRCFLQSVALDLKSNQIKSLELKDLHSKYVQR